MGERDESEGKYRLPPTAIPVKPGDLAEELGETTSVASGPTRPPGARTPSRPWSNDGYTSLFQDRATYYTTSELARELGVWQQQVYRWAKAWFGQLPNDRRSVGYRIPKSYLYVARAWMQVEDHDLRVLVRDALAKNPKNYVVVVGKVASTHYSVGEVVRRVTELLPVATSHNVPVQIIYVGGTPVTALKPGPGQRELDKDDEIG